MQSLLLERMRPVLEHASKVLDAGGGRKPFVPPEARPVGGRYVGADVSREELEAAPAGAYDATMVVDLSRPLPTDERFDVIVSWQVLEHVASMDQALANLHAALVPGGVLFAQVSGGLAVFSLAARLLPHRARVMFMKRLLGSLEEEKFPTHYDQCTARRLRRILQEGQWESVEIVSYYRAAYYFEFSWLLEALYLQFEDRLERWRIDNLATHYLIVARACIGPLT